MTTAARLPMPGALWGRYPERRGARRDPAPWTVAARRYGEFTRQVERLDFRGLADAGLAARAAKLRQRLVRGGLADCTMAQALGIVAEMAARELGQRPHRAQIFAARVLLDNRLAEMATGEGKTLAAALAAATAALARIPVHLITVNDYLARRDGERLRPLYARLGLSTGIVTQEMDPQARRAAYASDITYCTAKELVFDYLRDSMARGRDAGGLPERLSQLRAKRTVLRGLCMAIIDEADSVLIDEARVPFILSRARRDDVSREYYGRALALASTLLAQRDYELDREARRATLTGAGQDLAAREVGGAGALWRVRRYREEAVGLALCALHLFHKDRDYLVRAGKVELIDETTGRTAAGRAWSRGLQQLIELKEGCQPSAAIDSAAQITYQRFFSRYLRLSGMSGTLVEGRGELRHVYGLRVTRVPLRTPGRRATLPTRVFATAAARWQYVAERARVLGADGRAVLIGTDTVAESQELSALLHGAGVAHAVLNASQDRDEAQVVSRAGAPGRVTVATSMAGRGTDIAIDPGVADHGGLHVILCQANASARIDQQFLGRCARRGEPGSCETLLSAEAEAVRGRLPAWLVSPLRRGPELEPRWLARALVRFALALERRRQTQLRRALWKQTQDHERQPILGGSGT
jgi:preprotein translocase subunit SecA